jgi:hypothetical protein
MKNQLALLGLTAMVLFFSVQAAEAQTQSCIKSSYDGEPVQGVISFNPYQVDPNNCIDSPHAPAGTAHSVDTSGDGPGVSVSFESAVPVSSITIDVNDGGCPLLRTFPSNLGSLSGRTSGTFSLTFASNSGVPNFIGMSQVNVTIIDANGNAGGYALYHYCRAPGGSAAARPPTLHQKPASMIAGR